MNRHTTVAVVMSVILFLSIILWAFNLGPSGNGAAFDIAALIATASLSGLTACVLDNLFSRRAAAKRLRTRGPLSF